MTDLAKLSAGATPSPWHLCRHLEGVAEDAACPCGYRGVVFGPEHSVAYAVFQPGHEKPRDPEEDGSEPARYDRATEITNAQFIVALVNAYRTGQLVERDGVVEIARYLIDQQDEPFPDGSHKADSDRLHYWRDKCIYGARRLTAIKGGDDAATTGIAGMSDEAYDDFRSAALRSNPGVAGSKPHD